jgi:ATP-dependent exoDNAse (exonuclease V) beta subunit
LAEVERKALADGVALLDNLVALAARLPLDELVETLLDRSGYRLHLLLMGESREALGNLQTFLRMAEQHRKQPLGTFLDIWDRWQDQDTGLPQAPLYSAADDVVTVTTIHRAKGLEWPVVFLIDTASDLITRTNREYWIDHDHGPLLGPKQDDTGPRAAVLIARYTLEDRAEEARLLYVAATRARDRLVITGPDPKPGTYLQWLAAGADQEVVSDWTSALELEPRMPGAGVALDWLDRLRPAPLPTLAEALPAPPLRHLTSATEIMMQDGDPDQWTLRYLHGVEPVWAFAADGDGDAVPARVRGTIIHGALERYPPGPLELAEQEEELARILDEVIGELDAPELEAYLAPGQAYRRALAQEIGRVVSGDEWRWYTDGEHYRELPFLHLVERGLARTGSFDLYRLGGDEALIVDFKTHQIDASEVEAAARAYATQVRVYREAALLRSPARVRLHFTSPGVVVEE